MTIPAGHQMTVAELDALINPARYGCTLVAAAQNIASGSGGTGTAISWTTAAEDTAGFIAAPATTITIPATGTGIYQVTVRQLMASITVNRAYLALKFTSTLTAGTDDFRFGNINSNEGGRMVVSATMPLAAGDTFQALTYQTSGVTLSLTGSLFCYRISS
jgi:hypothetical protein